MIWEIIKTILEQNWEFISSGVLAFIIRMIEKAQNKKRLIKNIEAEFPQFADKIKDTINRA